MLNTQKVQVVRGDVYSRLGKDELVVPCQVTGFSKSRHVVYAQSLVGTPVSLPSSAYYKPVHAENGFSEVLSADSYSRPGEEIVKGTFIVSICQRVEGLTAVRWCTKDEMTACQRSLNLLITQLEVAEEEAAEATRLAQVEAAKRIAEAQARRAEQDAAREAELTLHPPTYAEAIARGWEVEKKGTGRQVILIRRFEGEDKPRRITKHLPPKSGMPTKKATVSRSLVPA
ncbi:MAG: hypothetical protein AAB455_03375 [Patescibacteria group bacterium]